MIAIKYFYGEQVGNAYYLHDVNTTIKRRMAEFRCGCGKHFYAPINKVKGFEILGCGCMKGKSLRSRNNFKHGGRKHKLYNVWCGMKARCYNNNHIQYKDYGGRGVAICKEWRGDFKNFFEWSLNNGWVEGLQIDKDIKGNGLLYSPNTCCFVTAKINSLYRDMKKKVA